MRHVVACRSSGSALLAVLWVVTILAAIVAMAQFDTRIDSHVAQNNLDRARALSLGRAGVQRALATLAADVTGTDSLEDTWVDDETVFRGELDEGEFAVWHGDHDAGDEVTNGVVDEASKLNINTATREMLLALPEMTEEIAEALLDWRDEDNEMKPKGTEREYYLGLEHPYETKNDQLDSIRELLCVAGVTRELFYGEDTNGNDFLDRNEDDGDSVPPADNGDGRLDRGFRSYITVHSYEKNQAADGTARVDIKKGTAAQIALVPGLNKKMAESIVAFRKGNEFKTILDIMKVTQQSIEEKTRRDEKRGQSRTKPSPGGQGTRARGRRQQQPERPKGKGNPIISKSLFQKIADYITVSEDEEIPGRININTASREVLACLPGVNETLADRIIARRGSESGPFKSVAGLLDVSGVNAEALGKFIGSVCVRSNVFTIRSEGIACQGRVRAQIEAIVDRGDDMKILYRRECD